MEKWEENNSGILSLKVLFNTVKFLDAPKWITENMYVKYNRDVNKIQEIPVVDIITHPQWKNNEKLKVQRLQPWAKVWGLLNTKHPLFQFQNNGKDYEIMELGMQKFYQGIQNRAKFPEIHMKAGVHAVFCSYRAHNEYKRVRILGPAKELEIDYDEVEVDEDYKRVKQVPIMLVDGGYTLKVIPGELLFLYEQFSHLPPRDLGLTVDGMSHYSVYQSSFTRASCDETGIWNGLMDAVILDEETKAVVVYSDLAPVTRFPYGVNELIIRRIAAELDVLQLPDVSEIRAGAYVVNQTSKAKVYIQFQSIFDNHFVSVMAKSVKKIKKLQGKVKLPVLPGTMVFVPFDSFVNTFYRAICLKNNSEDLAVEVKYLDYGDTASVNICDVVLATDVHPAFCAIPPLAIPGFLFGIEDLDVNAFANLVSPETPVVVKVINRDAKIAEVELQRTNTGGKTEKLVSNNGVLRWTLCDPPEFKIGPFANLTLIPHDILTADGSGSECMYYRAGNEILFNVVDIDERGTAMIYPNSVSKELEKLENDLDHAYYHCAWKETAETIYIENWTEGHFFMAQSSRFQRVVRVCISKTPAEVRQTYLECFLIDYGDIENLWWEEFRVMHPKNQRFPAHGCRANVTLKAGEKFLPEFRLRDLLGTSKTFRGRVISAYKEGVFAKAEIEFVDTK